MTQNNAIQQNYGARAERQQNMISRQHSKTFDQKSFNNWVKAVLINHYTKQMCNKVEVKLDLNRRNNRSKLLHVLDIGCGRGQDIKKWKLARVSYMFSTDFSAQCIEEYVKRWQASETPYKLYTYVGDFTSPELYHNLQHSFYDMVSAQFSFHYMFQSENGLKQGLANILSNLLIQGVFIATVPDSYTIMKKIKTKGVQNKDGDWVYGNKYFSMKFKNKQFYQPYGNTYGFYLQGAVGNKNQETGQIQYTPQWLMDLDSLQELMKIHGVVIEETMNFVDFYLKHREQYKFLFSRFKLNYQADEHMEEDLWEIVHLYRVIVCRKVDKGKSIEDFGLAQRQQAIKENNKRYDNYNTGERHNNDRRNYHRDHSHNHNNRGNYRQHQSNRSQYHNDRNSQSRNDYSRSRNKKY